MKVSIVIPVYNKYSSLQITIDSIINQSYEDDFEIILVDDGSTDKSWEIIKENSEKFHNIKAVSKLNGGESDARNIGILNSSHDYVAFLDADDVWESDFLKNIKELNLKYPVSEVLCTKYKRVSGSSINHPYHDIWENDNGIIEDYFKQVNETLGDMILTSSSVCIKKSVFSKVGLFTYGDKLGADQDFWFRIFKKKIKVAYTSKVCVSYILDADERVCESYNRYGNLNFIDRNFRFSNSFEENRYLANALLGAINDVFAKGNKLKSLFFIIKDLDKILYATPKRILATVAKVFK